jgi:ABC-2 type transport system permease protein
MPRALALFAEHQPMTPVIDSLRALMLNQPVGNNLVLGLAWSTGVILAAFVIAVQVYKRKVS